MSTLVFADTEEYSNTKIEQNTQEEDSKKIRSDIKEDLPAETKAQIKELREKLKSGEITEEEFEKQMEKIMPEGFKFKMRIKNGKELPEEVKTEIKELREKLKNGKITKEEFKEEIAKHSDSDTAEKFDETYQNVIGNTPISSDSIANKTIQIVMDGVKIQAKPNRISKTKINGEPVFLIPIQSDVVKINDINSTVTTE
jgi:uncharacterized membrane protein